VSSRARPHGAAEGRVFEGFVMKSWTFDRKIGQNTAVVICIYVKIML